MDIEEEPFERLNIGEVAIDIETNEFRKMIKKTWKKCEYDISEDKINMQVLRIMSMKTNGDLKIGNVNTT